MAITKCPHCESSAFIRDSVQQSSLVRTAVGVCKDPYCGHTFKITISVDYSLSPSGKPNPRVNLPLSSKLHSSQVRA